MVTKLALKESRKHYIALTIHLTCSWFFGWAALYLGITHACMVVIVMRQDKMIRQEKTIRSSPRCI
jgi:hypothetical protein